MLNDYERCSNCRCSSADIAEAGGCPEPTEPFCEDPLHTAEGIINAILISVALATILYVLGKLFGWW